MTLPAGLRIPKPMLAVAGTTIGPDPDQVVAELTRRGWLFDIKWDGIRALAVLDGSRVTLRTRDGQDITVPFPDVVATLAPLLLPAELVLDGELVCLDGDRPSLERVQHRAAQTNPRRAAEAATTTPATFVAFDLLFAGRDRRGAALTTRHAELTRLAETCGPAVSVTDRDGAAMLHAARTRSLEGLVAKDPTSRYHAGHHPAWVKIKLGRSLTALVTGTKPGNGSRTATFGSLRLALLDPAGEPVDIGSVGTGFSRNTLADLSAQLAAGHTVLVDVAYQSLTRRGRLRGAVFRSQRRDLTATDCTTDQLHQ